MIKVKEEMLDKLPTIGFEKGIDNYNYTIKFGLNQLSVLVFTKDWSYHKKYQVVFYASNDATYESIKNPNAEFSRDREIDKWDMLDEIMDIDIIIKMIKEGFIEI